MPRNALRQAEFLFAIGSIIPSKLIFNIGSGANVHAINLDSAGNDIYGPPENGERYPASTLRGTGVIAGRLVQCISAEDAVKFHSGYELDQNDFHDVLALCEKFGIEIPDEYGQSPPGAGQSSEKV